MARPDCILSPEGDPITLDDLPPAGCDVRWVISRKALVVTAIRDGLIIATEACERYALSETELESWARMFRTYGRPGLRITKLQLYRQA